MHPVRTNTLTGSTLADGSNATKDMTERIEMSDITVLTWVIGLGGTFFMVLMGVMWAYILRAVGAIYEHINGEVEKVEGLLTKQYDEHREDFKDADRKFALKDDVNELKGNLASVRSEMNLQFGSLNTQMGGLSAQLSSIVGIITKTSRGD